MKNPFCIVLYIREPTYSHESGLQLPDRVIEANVGGRLSRSRTPFSLRGLPVPVPELKFKGYHRNLGRSVPDIATENTSYHTCPWSIIYLVRSLCGDFL